uniref:Uncharacterized protein n=1 Tax=Arundo donax TaxID=35708 RepID=A0A0A9EFM1_ARUDO
MTPFPPVWSTISSCFHLPLNKHAYVQPYRNNTAKSLQLCPSLFSEPVLYCTAWCCARQCSGLCSPPLPSG